MKQDTTFTDKNWGWTYLGSYPMKDANGVVFGSIVMLKNAHNYPIEATFIGEDDLAAQLVDYSQLDSKQWRVRWSAKRKKWYIFKEGGNQP